MPPIAILGVAAAGVAGSVASSVIQKNAQENAGNAAASAATKGVGLAQTAIGQEEAQQGQAVQYAQQYGAMSAGEYASINSMISTNANALSASLSSIDKQQQQLDAASPEVKAAGGNLLSLLQGKASDMLAPVQAQQQRARQALEGQLASQMGPGYASTSAGIQALTAFDQQSALANSQIQLNAVNQATSTYGGLFGLQQQGQNAITSQTQGAYGAAAAGAQSVFSANNAVQNRLDSSVLNAYTSFKPNFGLPVTAQTGVTQTAGLPFQGQNTLGAGIGGLATGLGQVAGQVYGQQQAASTLGQYAKMGLPTPTPVANAPASNTSFVTGRS